MFSGIVEKTSKTISIKKYNDGLLLEIENPYEILEEGESISVDGCCLTVEKFNSKSIFFFLSLETLSRTKFSKINLYEHIFNLERSLTLNKLIGGHLVLGHVDCVGKVIEVKNFEMTKTIKVFFEEKFRKYLVYKGSICLDGVSLTVNRINDNYFEVVLIPKTLNLTNLKFLKEGDYVNLEFDIIAKYVENFIKIQK
ncbi:MAG: riboflavin synthase [candidate division WOR-3 bacterium]